MAKKPASGMYKTKARNLTDAQLKRAKGAKAAGKRTLSVSDTSRATTGANKGYTLGPGGKRLTGTVVMANGDRAVYKGGKRVTNMPKSSMKDKTLTRGISSRAVTGGGGGGGGDKPTKKNAPALSMAERKRLQAGRPNWVSGAKRKTTRGPGRTATPSQRGEGSQLVWDENAQKWVRK